MYQRALAIRENVLGADHQLTLDTRAHLQEALVVLGQTHEAASMMGAHKQKKMAEEPKQIPEV